MMHEIPTAFLAGIAASVSPCDYPLLPVIIGYLGTQAGPDRRPRVLLYALGQVVTLVSLGIIAVTLGEAMGFSSENPIIRKGMGLVMLISAIISWKGTLPQFLTKWTQRGGQSTGRGHLAAFLLGAGGTLLISPCTSPILGSVLMMLASGGSLLQGLVLMSSYALGFSLVFLLLGLGLVQLTSLPRSGRWLIWVQRLGAIVLFGAGTYFLAGIEMYV